MRWVWWMRRMHRMVTAESRRRAAVAWRCHGRAATNRTRGDGGRDHEIARRRIAKPRLQPKLPKMKPLIWGDASATASTTASAAASANAVSTTATASISAPAAVTSSRCARGDCRGRSARRERGGCRSRLRCGAGGRHVCRCRHIGSCRGGLNGGRAA